MRPFGEPEKVAFESLSDRLMDKREAAENRRNEFWGALGESLLVKIGQADDPEYSRNSIKKEILGYLKSSASMLSKGTEKGIPLWLWSDETIWENVKFIVAFNMEYDYCDEDDETDGVFEDSDCLDDEIGFRYDVIKECNKYILEGAALCKKIGSPAYDTWIEAMVRLNDTYIGSKPYNAVDLIDKAYPRTWADLCTFIHMNPPCNAKKKAVKKKKANK